MPIKTVHFPVLFLTLATFRRYLAVESPGQSISPAQEQDLPMPKMRWMPLRSPGGEIRPDS